MLLALSFDIDCLFILGYDDYVSHNRMISASARHRNHLLLKSSLLHDVLINERCYLEHYGL